jgi:hypothetical protein
MLISYKPRELGEWCPGARAFWELFSRPTDHSTRTNNTFIRTECDKFLQLRWHPTNNEQKSVFNGRFSGCSGGTKGRYGLGIGFQICAAKVIKIASAFSCRARTTGYNRVRSPKAQGWGRFLPNLMEGSPPRSLLPSRQLHLNGVPRMRVGIEKAHAIAPVA